jgi:hypothetical protein
LAATPITAIIRPQNGQGVAPPAAQAADTVNGNTFTNDGREFLLIANAGGASATVTIAQTQTLEGVSTAGLQIVVPAGSSRWTSYLTPGIYGNSPTITVPGGTTVTYLLLALPAGV